MKRPRVLLCLASASATAALALACLSGCADSATASSSPPASASPSSDTASVTEHTQSALTCAVLSSMVTEVENARAAHDAGTLSDAGDAAIINTVPTTIVQLQRTQNAGLQDELRNLAVDLTFTKPTVAGAVFDPDSAPYINSMHQAMSTCEHNGTPIWIQRPPGQG